MWQAPYPYAGRRRSDHGDPTGDLLRKDETDVVRPTRGEPVRNVASMAIAEADTDRIAPRRRRGTVVIAATDRDPTAGDPARFSEDMAAVAERKDREAFGRLFGHFAPRVKSYMLRLGMADAHADDLAQETLLTVWRKASLFDPAKANAATWIFAIARNLRVDALRRERRPLAPEEELALIADDAPLADAVLAQRQAVPLLLAALADLPGDQAAVIRLSFFDDLPHSAIAERLGVPIGTVKSRVRLAMGKIRQAIGKELL